MKFETVSNDIYYVKERYKFITADGKRWHLSPEYNMNNPQVENHVMDEVDAMYDGFVELCRDVEGGELYGVWRDTQREGFPIMLWQRMALRDE